jgi:hypothetical protein
MQSIGDGKINSMKANVELASGQPTTSSWSAPVNDYVCWSRMQAEAGQPLEEIVARKERERRLNGGLFLWGVGNAPALVANRLARAHVPIPVIFSVMKSRPKQVDASPTRTFAWRRYIDEEGVERKLPRHSLVTSRSNRATGVKRSHYALMCYSDTPLEVRRGVGYFHHAAFRNAGGTGAPVGPSQVTALLRRIRADGGGTSDYEINLRAWLTGGYWVRLTDPAYVTQSAREQLAAEAHMADDAWIELVDNIGSGPPVSAASHPADPLLL